MKTVYAVFAIETNGMVDGSGEPIDTFDVYAIGETEEIAQAIIKKDVEDGQIYDNAFIQKMDVTETMEEV